MKIGKGTIFLIIILIGLLAYSGYLLYEKPAVEKNPNQSSNELIGNNNNNTVEMPEVIDGYKRSVTGTNVQIFGDREFYQKLEVKVPKILSSAPNAKQLNTRMENELINEGKIDEYINDIELNKWSFASYSIDYKAATKNNVIVIETIRGGAENYASGISIEIVNYFYDAENDRILDMRQGLTKLGYDESKVISEINRKRKALALPLYEESKDGESIYEKMKKEPYAGVEIDEKGNIGVIYYPDLGV